MKRTPENYADFCAYMRSHNRRITDEQLLEIWLSLPMDGEPRPALTKRELAVGQALAQSIDSDAGGRLKISAFFRWYDLWIGAYWDRSARVLYVCPVPMFGFRIAFGKKAAQRG